MKSDNVIEMAEHREPFPAPAHLKVGQRRAWDQLVGDTPAALHVNANRLTFEIAALLLAKFRSGRAMSATEFRQMHGALTDLGLSKNVDPRDAAKPTKASKYLDDDRP